MKPILFNTEMVRAILDGRKTVTRRVVKGIENTWKFLEISDPLVLLVTGKNGDDREKKVPGTWAAFEGWNGETDFPCVKCPYSPGDILYVRETWAQISDWLVVDPDVGLFDGYFYKTDWEDGAESPKWRPSIHMPKDAARIFLRVKGARVERLHDINEEQARAEGARPVMISTDPEGTPDEHRKWHDMGNAILNFVLIWDTTINPTDLPRYGWEANPWVWVIEFERVSREEAYTYQWSLTQTNAWAVRKGASTAAESGCEP